jgi:hypothetical protein
MTTVHDPARHADYYLTLPYLTLPYLTLPYLTFSWLDDTGQTFAYKFGMISGDRTALSTVPFMCAISGHLGQPRAYKSRG